jgi:hypothetical protein
MRPRSRGSSILAWSVFGELEEAEYGDGGGMVADRFILKPGVNRDASRYPSLFGPLILVLTRRFLSRRFPCKNCITRRLPERCIPPPGHPLYRDPALGPIAPGSIKTDGNPASHLVPFPPGMGSNDGGFPSVPVGLPHSGGIPFSVPGPSVPQIPAPLAHLPDLTAVRRTNEFGDVRIPGVMQYHVGDPYRPSSAPGMGFNPDQDVPYGMVNKRRKLDREISSHGNIAVKPEMHRMPSIGGTILPPPSDGMRPLLADKSASQAILPKMPAKDPVPESAGLAETTARLARLERLLTLQDHTYAEKRLRLAEEAALRMLEGGGENSIFGSASTPGTGQAVHVENGRTDVGYPAANRAQLHQGQDMRLETSATGSNLPHSRSQAAGSVDHDDDGAENHHDGAEVKGRFGRWDTVEIIGDAGYTGAEGLNALTAASALVSEFAGPDRI